jgi:hypothetical protein
MIARLLDLAHSTCADSGRDLAKSDKVFRASAIAS